MIKVFRCLIPFITFILSATYSFAQNDTCNLKISLLTCGPGEDLYSLFGHSALRVTDRSDGTDIIYNYGTFDFEDPDFYIKFVRGKLLYFVSVQRFELFVHDYRLENRNIIEQEFQLTCDEKRQLYNALRINAQEENKYYRYEFLFDNCSTRLRDIVATNADDSVTFKRIVPAPAPSFRNMIHEYLNRGKQYWSKFGIDLALGSRVDRKVKNEEAMFLPDYLMKGFDSAVLRHSSIVASKNEILPSSQIQRQEARAFFTPLVIGCLLLFAGAAVTFSEKQSLLKAGDIFDIGYFLFLGIAGAFLLFMWMGTDHELCRDNYNLLWALPTHLPAAFIIVKRYRFIRVYFAISAILAFLLVALWPILPQGLNIAFLPLILLAGIRSIYRWKKK